MSVSLDAGYTTYGVARVTSEDGKRSTDPSDCIINHVYGANQRYPAMVERTTTWRFLMMLLLLTAVMLGDVTLLNLIASSVRVGPNWDSFVPDLIVGLITTGALGLLLWYFSWQIERGAERRDATRIARIRWSTVGRRVSNIVNTEQFKDNVTDASNLGPIATELVNLLQDEPLDEWHAALGKPEIARTLRALKSLEKTIALGRAINDDIRFWHMTSSFSKPLTLEQATAILVGSTYGFGLQETALMMGVKRRHISTLLRDIDRSRNADLDSKLGVYALNRLQAETNVQQLKAQPD